MRGWLQHRASLGLDKLHSASEHLARQFDRSDSHEKALANLQARQTIFHCANKILKESGWEITQAELQQARTPEMQP